MKKKTELTEEYVWSFLEENVNDYTKLTYLMPKQNHLFMYFDDMVEHPDLLAIVRDAGYRQASYAIIAANLALDEIGDVFVNFWLLTELKPKTQTEFDVIQDALLEFTKQYLKNESE